MLDIWSDMKQWSFFNTIAYSPIGAILMNSFGISLEKKTGLYLKNILSSVLENNCQKIGVQFIIDNASNFEFACKKILGKYPTCIK